MSEVRLDGARWVQCSNGFVGALDGCLQALGDSRHPDDLMGLTGFAFRLHLHPDLSPASLYLFDWHHRFSRIFDRLGYLFTLHYADRADLLFGARQKNAMDVVVRHLDAERPLLAWNLDLPDFYLVSGYDIPTLALVASGPSTASEVKQFPLETWGASAPGGLALIEIGERFQVDPAEATARALLDATRHARDEETHLPNHRNGLAAFGVLARALRSGSADPHGAGYWVHSLAHSRASAARYLRRSLDLLEPARRDPLGEAAAHYGVAAERLKSAAAACPFPPSRSAGDRRSAGRRREAAAAVAAAGRAEALGVAAIERAFRLPAPAGRGGVAAAKASRRASASRGGGTSSRGKSGRKGIASDSAAGRSRRRH